MILHSVIVPPRPALDQLVDVVRSVRRAPDVEAESRWRIFRRHGDAPQQPAVSLLEERPIPSMQIPIAGFGNVTPADTTRIVQALAAAASEWKPPRVRFMGLADPKIPADGTVWVRLRGDIEALTEIGRGVPRSVERVGFFVDRRRFRPMLAVARLSSAATAADWEHVVETLDSFRGREWVVDTLVLTKLAFDGPNTASQEHERIPIGVQ